MKTRKVHDVSMITLNVRQILSNFCILYLSIDYVIE